MKLNKDTHIMFESRHRDIIRQLGTVNHELKRSDGHIYNRLDLELMRQFYTQELLLVMRFIGKIEAEEAKE